MWSIFGKSSLTSSFSIVPEQLRELVIRIFAPSLVRRAGDTMFRGSLFQRQALHHLDSNILVFLRQFAHRFPEVQFAIVVALSTSIAIIVGLAEGLDAVVAPVPTREVESE